MKSDFYNLASFMDTLRDRRRKRDGSALSLLDSEIYALRDIMSLIIDDYVIECQIIGKLEEAESMLAYHLKMRDGDPLVWASLAKNAAFYKGDFKLAKEYLEKAIICAEQAGDLYINCNMDAIEIYKVFSDADGINTSLLRVLNYNPDDRTVDSNYDVNYVKNLAKYGADKDLVDKYVEKFGKDS